MKPTEPCYLINKNISLLEQFGWFFMQIFIIIPSLTNIWSISIEWETTLSWYKVCSCWTLCVNPTGIPIADVQYYWVCVCVKCYTLSVGVVRSGASHKTSYVKCLTFLYHENIIDYAFRDKINQCLWAQTVQEPRLSWPSGVPIQFFPSYYCTEYKS